MKNLQGWIYIGLIALAVLAFVAGYIWSHDANEPHRVVSGAVCGADELSVPYLATACAEAKSACGSGCQVWDEIDAPDLSGIPGFSDPPLPIPDGVE